MAAVAAALALPAAQVASGLALKYVPLLLDKIFGGNGTGPLKLSAATGIMQAINSELQKMVPGFGPATDAAEVQKQVQDSVNALQAAGKLQGSATVVDPSAGIVGNKALAKQLLAAATALYDAN